MLSKLFENEEYLADLRGNMPARAVAKKWGLGSKTTVTRHRAKLGRIDGVVGGAYRNPATGSYTIPIERDAVTMKPVKKHGKKGDVVTGGRIVGHKESSTGEAEYTVSHSKQLTLADADEWVRQAGKDPADYNLSVYTTAYGDGLWSNRITASPKVRKNVADFDIPKLTREEIDALFVKPKKAVRASAPKTSVFLLADAQLGQTDGVLGTQDTVERALRAGEQFRDHIEKLRPAEVVIVDVGDIIENILNVSNKQLSTNDLDLVDQVTTARRLVLELIRMFEPHTDKVVFISVPSNHGEVRVGRGQAVGAVSNDWGIEINKQVSDVVGASAIAGKVSCITPDKHDITVRFETVDGSVLAFTHGDKASSGNTVGKWVSGQVSGRQPGWDADLWFVGHYHNAYVLQVGDRRWLVGCPAVSNGSGWFTHRTGERAVSGVLVLDVVGGLWENLRILS